MTDDDEDIIISGGSYDNKSIDLHKSKKPKEDKERKSMADELRYKTMRYNNKVKKHRVQLQVEKIRREALDQAGKGKDNIKYYSPLSDEVVQELRNQGLTYRVVKNIYYVEW